MSQSEESVIQLQEYRSAVEYLAKNKSSELMLNSGNEHAVIIFENIFKQSNSHLRIAAKSLLNKEVANNVDYLKSLKGFLEKGKNVKLQILLTDYKKGEFELTDLYKLLCSENKNDKVEIKHTKANKFKNGVGEEVNFCVGDSFIYRLEYDINDRKAKCCFNDESMAGNLISVFDGAFSQCESISLNTTN